MTREVGLGLSKGRPTPQGLPERLLAGDCGLETRLWRGSVSGRVLWRRGVWSRLLCRLFELQLVIFPTSASLARSFSTSGGKKRTGARCHTLNLKQSTRAPSEWVSWCSFPYSNPVFPELKLNMYAMIHVAFNTNPR